MSKEPRPLTAAELRERLLSDIDGLVSHWASQRLAPDYTTEQRMRGLVHSLLVYLDGQSGSSPCAYQLVADCPPEDDMKAEAIAEGLDTYVIDGTEITDGNMLHDEWGKRYG